MDFVNREIRCDGCGAPATSEHLRRRTERLELATRFRPIHIECLVLYPAPPERFEDYFYQPAKNGNERSAEARRFFEGVMNAAGVEASQGKDEEALLAELQRKGWFVTPCRECPLVKSGAVKENVAEKYAETVNRRIKFSYRPKRIVLAARSLEPLGATLEPGEMKEKPELKDWFSD